MKKQIKLLKHLKVVSLVFLAIAIATLKITPFVIGFGLAIIALKIEDEITPMRRKIRRNK